MTLERIAVSGYRSLQNVVLPLGNLTLVCGANGAGKSNLYRSLRLLSAAARGDLVAVLAAEGGLPAVLWAGPERLGRAMKSGELPVQGGPRTGPVRLRLGFGGSELSYAIELGYPAEAGSAFHLDPQIKREWIWAGSTFHPDALLLERSDGAVLRHGGGRPVVVTRELASFESLLTAVTDPLETPEAFRLRRELLGWRFYDGFRTDATAPARRTPIASRCPSLAADGGDLPAAVRTIEEVGDWEGFQAAIDDAFPGCLIAVDVSSPRFRLQMEQPGLLRPLEATELSDGTLRYVLLATALFSPRLPSLLMLNEPENSLHPDLLLPLARLILAAAARTQVWVVAHAPPLIEAVSGHDDVRVLALDRELGATRLPGQTALDRAAWRWPAGGGHP
jgi:predicted ATPase